MPTLPSPPPLQEGNAYAPTRNPCLPPRASRPFQPHPRLHSKKGPCPSFDSWRGLAHSSTSNLCLPTRGSCLLHLWEGTTPTPPQTTVSTPPHATIVCHCAPTSCRLPGGDSYPRLSSSRGAHSLYEGPCPCLHSRSDHAPASHAFVGTVACHRALFGCCISQWGMSPLPFHGGACPPPPLHEGSCPRFPLPVATKGHGHAPTPRGAYGHASPLGWAMLTLHRNRCLPRHASRLM